VKKIEYYEIAKFEFNVKKITIIKTKRERERERERKR